MITRRYFYQVETQTPDSKFGYGIIALESWFPKPEKAIDRIIKDVKSLSGATDDQINIVTFNKV